MVRSGRTSEVQRNPLYLSGSDKICARQFGLVRITIVLDSSVRITIEQNNNSKVMVVYILFLISQKEEKLFSAFVSL